jgi:8-amino-7-oxononanoate synthase
MRPLDEFEAFFDTTLRNLRDEGLLRHMRLPRGIDLVSNDYLGFVDHPYMRDSMREALRCLPAGSGGSRLLRGHHPVFEDLEDRLAEWSGTGAAILFGSGYAANLGLIQTLVTADDLVLSDRLNHASLIDAIRLARARACVYAHQDLDELERLLKQPRTGRALVVTESVFSMDGDLTPLQEIVALAERHGAAVVVDEAHATGLYGRRGSGRVEELGLRDRVLATVHTGGKALGSGGAWVAGSGALCQMIVNSARSFIFSTAPLPVLAAALGAALDLLGREPARVGEVHRKAALLRHELANLGVSAGGGSLIVPIVVGANERALALQEALAEAGFDVRAVRPPSVPLGTARLRVTVRYPVGDSDLLRFAASVSRMLKMGSDQKRGQTPFYDLRK